MLRPRLLTKVNMPIVKYSIVSRRGELHSPLLGYAVLNLLYLGRMPQISFVINLWRSMLRPYAILSR
jgi:hypothetical protein